MATVDPKNLYSQIKPDEEEEIAVSTDDVGHDDLAMLDETDPVLIQAKEEEEQSKKDAYNKKKTFVDAVDDDESLSNFSGEKVYSIVFDEFIDGAGGEFDPEVHLEGNPRGVQLIKAFQKAENLEVTGMMDEDTHTRLFDYNKDHQFKRNYKKMNDLRIAESAEYPSIIDGIPAFRPDSPYWKGKNIDNMTSSELAVYNDWFKDIEQRHPGSTGWTKHGTRKLDWRLDSTPIDIDSVTTMIGKIEPLGYNPGEIADSKGVRSHKVFDHENREYVNKDIETIHYQGKGSLSVTSELDSKKLEGKMWNLYGEDYVGFNEMMNFSVTGLNPQMDYSTGYHTIYMNDSAGNINTVQIVPVPVLYGMPGIGLNAWDATHSKINAKFVPYDGSDSSENEWVLAIDEVNALINKFNETPASDQVTRRSIAKKINKFHLLNSPSEYKYEGDKRIQNISETGIWVPNDNSEFELQSNSKVSLWVNGEPFSGIAGAQGDLRIQSVSPDGEMITFTDGVYGHTVTHSLYDIVNKDVTTMDMHDFWQASKIQLGDTFIYTPTPEDIGTLDRAELIRNDPVAQRSIETGDVTLDDLMRGETTSIEKGVLHWINPNDMSIIEDIAAFDELSVEVGTDAVGRTVVSVSRGESAPDKIIAEYTDGTSMEVNTEKYKSWLSLKNSIDAIRKIAEGTDMDDPNWVSPYQIEEQMKNIQAKIQAFNVMYGDDAKLETRRLYRALLDTYFDRTLDYVVPTPDDAYQFYYQMEQWNPLIPPLSKEEFFTYNGWEEGVNPYDPDTFMGEMALKTGKGVRTASDIATQSRFLRNLVYYLEMNEFSGEGFQGDRVSEMEEGYNPVLGYQLGLEREDMLPWDSYDASAMHPSGNSIIEAFRSAEESWVDQYGQRFLGDDRRDFAEVQAGGSLGIDEYFGLTKMINYLKGGNALEETANMMLNHPMVVARDMIRHLRDIKQEDWDELSVFRNYFLQEILMNDEEVLKITQDMNDSGLVPFDIMAMDLSTQGKLYRSLFTFLNKGENLVTVPNIVMARATMGLYGMAKAGSIGRKILTGGLTAVFAPMVINEAWGTAEELIEELGKEGDQYNPARVDELWGEIVFDGLMVSPFAYTGGKGLYKRYQMTKTHGLKVSANPLIPHEFAMNVKPGGGSQVKGVKEQLGTSTSAQADAMAGIASQSYIASLLKTSEGRAIFERFQKKGVIDKESKKEIRKILDKDNAKNPSSGIEDGLALYDDIIKGFMNEFYHSKRYPNKDRTDWMHFLDHKFETLLKGRKGKKLNTDDMVVIRRNLGNQFDVMYKKVAKDIEDVNKFLKSKDQGLSKPTDTKNKKSSKGAKTDHDYAGNINLSYIESIIPGAKTVLRQISDNIGKAINDEVRFRNTGRGKKTKWTDADAKAVEPSQMETVLKMIMETPRDQLANLRFNDVDLLTARHILAGTTRHITNNLQKLKADGSLNQNYEMLVHIWNANQAMVASSGRALNYNKMKLSPQLHSQVQRMMHNDYKARVMFDELLTNADLDASTATKIMGSIVEMSRNMKLFSLSAGVKSIFGNGVNSVLHTADKPIAAVWDMLFTNMHRGAAWGTSKVYSLLGKEVPKWAQLDAKQTRFIGETLAYLNGMVKAYKPGTKSIEGGGSVYSNMKAMIKEDLSYLRTDVFYTRERFNTEGYLPGWFGKIVRSPQRAQAAIDIFYRQPAEMGWLHQLTYRELVKQGYKPGSQKFKHEFDELINNPPEKWINYVKGKAEEVTFQEQLGSFGQKIGQFRTGNISQISQIWFPFYNTPVNIWKQAYSRTPLAGIFSTKAKEGFGRGMKTGHWGDFADVQAKWTTGTLLTQTMFELAEGMWGEGNVFVTGNFHSYDDLTAEAMEELGIKRNSIVRYNEETGLYECYDMTGWEPLSGIIKAYAAFNGMHGGKFNPDKEEFINKFENAVAALTYEFMENPMLSGISDWNEVRKDIGEGDWYNVTGFVMETGRGIFMPNILAQYGRIRDPFYYVKPEMNEFRKDLYGYADDNHILWHQFEREVLSGLSGANIELLDEVKALADSKREEQFAVWKEEYSDKYTDEYLWEQLDKIPDMLLAKEIFNDYTMNLPKLSYFGFPIESKQGFGSIFGFNSYHQENMRPYWTVNPKHDELLNDKKFWMQSKNLIVEELIRLNVWENVAGDAKTIMGAKGISEYDKWLYKAISGQAKFQYLLDNMIFDNVYDDDGYQVFENGRPLMELNLDENGHIQLAKRWQEDLSGNLDEDDINKRIKILTLEDMIMPMLLEVGADQVLTNEMLDPESYIFNPRKDYNFLLTSPEWMGQDFKTWYIDQRRANGDVGSSQVVANAEVMEAYNQWQAYKELLELEGIGTEEKAFDLYQNYKMLLRDFKEEKEVIDKYEFKKP